jgi:hypothetical protein
MRRVPAACILTLATILISTCISSRPTHFKTRAPGESTPQLHHGTGNLVAHAGPALVVMDWPGGRRANWGSCAVTGTSAMVSPTSKKVAAFGAGRCCGGLDGCGLRGVGCASCAAAEAGEKAWAAGSGCCARATVSHFMCAEGVGDG